MNEKKVMASKDNEFIGKFIKTDYKNQFTTRLQQYQKYVKDLEEDLARGRNEVKKLEAEQDNWHETMSTLNRLVIEKEEKKWSIWCVLLSCIMYVWFVF